MRKPLLALAAIVALVASACVRSDTKIVVNDDGSGTIAQVTAINPDAIGQLAGSLGSSGSDPELAQLQDFCKNAVADAQQNVRDGAKVEKYQDGKFCGVKVSYSFKAGELDDALKELQSSENGVAGGNDISITKDGNGWRFSADIGGGTADASQAPPALVQSFFKDAFVVMRVNLPGRYVEKDSNADAIDGDGTMIWNVDLTNPKQLQARTEAGPALKNKTFTDRGKNVPGVLGGSGSGGSGGGGGSSTTWLWVVLGLVVVGGVAAFVLLRRRGASPAPAAAGAGAAGLGGPQPPMTQPPMTQPPMTQPPIAPQSPIAPQPPMTQPPAAPAAPADGPRWDPARNAYIQYDPAGQRWMQYDDAAQSWRPIE